MVSVVTLFYIMLDGLVFLSFFLAILVRHSCSLFYVPGKLISICQLDISYYLFGSNIHSIDFFTIILCRGIILEVTSIGEAIT